MERKIVKCINANSKPLFETMKHVINTFRGKSLLLLCLKISFAMLLERKYLFLCSVDPNYLTNIRIISILGNCK